METGVTHVNSRPSQLNIPFGGINHQLSANRSPDLLDFRH